MWNLHYHNPRSNPAMTGFNLGCVDEIDTFKLKNITVNDGHNHPLDKNKKMEDRFLNFNRIKKIFEVFTSQEVMSEPFRDKLGQLNNFYLPISKMIAEDYLKKKTKVIGLTGGQGTGKSTISSILKIILKEGYKLKQLYFQLMIFTNLK